jgi:hypothetical protein
MRRQACHGGAAPDQPHGVTVDSRHDGSSEVDVVERRHRGVERDVTDRVGGWYGDLITSLVQCLLERFGRWVEVAAHESSADEDLLRRDRGIGVALADLNVVDIRGPEVGLPIPVRIADQTHALANPVAVDHVRTRRHLMPAVRGRVPSVIGKGIVARYRSGQREGKRSGHRPSGARAQTEDDGPRVGRLDATDLGAGRRVSLCADEVAEVDADIRVRHGLEEAALDGVLDVLGRHLATDRRREPHARPQVDRQRFAVGADLRKAGREVGDRVGGVVRPEAEEGALRSPGDLGAGHRVADPGINRIRIGLPQDGERATAARLLALRSRASSCARVSAAAQAPRESDCCDDGHREPDRVCASHAMTSGFQRTLPPTVPVRANVGQAAPGSFGRRSWTASAP